MVRIVITVISELVLFRLSSFVRKTHPGFLFLIIAGCLLLFLVLGWWLALRHECEKVIVRFRHVGFGRLLLIIFVVVVVSIASAVSSTAPDPSSIAFIIFLL